jgi:F-type H+-transporting ATPase subunit epsilon
MADQLEVAVVSAERSLWSGKAKSVSAKTPEGDVGILRGHEPMLALLVEAPLRIELEDGTKIFVAVHGGFFSVDSDKVNVIAETAELAEEVDLERAQAALARAKSEADEQDLSALRRAETRIQVAGVAKGVRS